MLFVMSSVILLARPFQHKTDLSQLGLLLYLAKNIFNALSSHSIVSDIELTINEEQKMVFDIF